MGLAENKSKLETMMENLDSAKIQANRYAQKGNFKSASQHVNNVLEESSLEYDIIVKETNQETTKDGIYREVSNLIKDIHPKLNELTGLHLAYSKAYSDQQLKLHAAEDHKKNSKGEHSKEYADAYTKLYALKDKEKVVNMPEHLNSFLKTIKDLRKETNLSDKELAEAMNKAHDRLSGKMTPEDFQSYANKAHRSDSIPRKILGFALIALGAALLFSALLFAPAVITAASVSLATIYLTATATTLTTTALTVGGAACFFKDTPRMELADAMTDLNKLQPTQAAPTV